MKNHLQFHWYHYLLAILLPVLLWSTVFAQLEKPALNEQLNILYVGQQLDTDALQAQLCQVLPELTSQPLKAVTVSCQLPEQVSYHDFFTARVFSFDLILMEGSQLKENSAHNYFLRLKEPLQQALSEKNLYTEILEDGNPYPYGLILSQDCRFSQYYSGNQACYLFFSPESVNLNALNGLGKTGDDCALQAANFLSESIP